MDTTTTPRLLVVDDEEVARGLLVRILNRAGYDDVLAASSGMEARRLLEENQVDLMLTDMQMPGGSGLELLHHVHGTEASVAALMVTATDDSDLANKALALGAYGYIIKPFRQSEVVIGVSNALRRRSLELENQNHRDHLEETVKLRTADLWDAIVKIELSEMSVRASRTETIARLAIAGEFRDEDTGFHVARMSRYCEILARECGNEELHHNIREASSLHDVGKIGIPDRILLKPGPLVPDERSIMQEHAKIGYRILKDSESPLLKLAAEIALTHHEWVDGSGYPNGLVGDSIPLTGRIAGIADVFDALTSNRVYRPALPLFEVIQLMKCESRSHFDADLLTAFWDVLPEVLAVDHEYGPQESLPGYSRVAGDIAVVRNVEGSPIGGSP
jgi:putative two-component system response regulator